MPSLVVRNIDSKVVQALKARAGEHGISAEAEHRKTLELVLLERSFSTSILFLKAIPLFAKIR